MSHVTGTVHNVAPPWAIGPDTGAPPGAGGVWSRAFIPAPAPTGTKFVVLHFRNVVLPPGNRLEVDLGYDTDVFTAPDGAAFWTRPIDVARMAGQQVPVRYVAAGSAAGQAELDGYGRGERHAGHQDPTALSNSDPFLLADPYVEPKYDPFWFCNPPSPRWENLRCAPQADIRRDVARSVGMLVTVHEDDPAHGPHVSTCSGTLIEPGLFISAGHCMGTDAEAAASSVTFDYETNCDGSVPVAYAPRFHKVVRVVARHWNFAATPPFDYVLLQVEPATGGLGVPPVPVRHDLPGVNEQIFGIHHPNGAVKKISPRQAETARVLGSSANGIRVNTDVSGGSSGSGLFDMQGRYLGILSTGGPCSLSYFPIVTVNQELANPQTPALTRDVMLVFDRSGSMSMDAGTGSSKIAEAREAASLFAQLVRVGTGNRVGLVSFSTSASAPVDFPLANFDGAARTALVGPSPYSGGVVGALQPDQLTAIGQGLAAARTQLTPPGPRPRAILLLTDGLQNVPPSIQDVGPTLTGIDVHAIGYGTAASLDGAVLTQLAQAHGGLYTQATDPLALRKFFALAFGNMFEAGALLDPSGTLQRGQDVSAPVPFDVSDEDTVTVVLGWEPDEADLRLRITTPTGQAVQPGAAGVEADAGRSWAFVRVPLPHNGEREGTWTAEVIRPSVGSELAIEGPQARYFVNVLAAGGPRLRHVPRPRRLYSGDSVNPLVVLRRDDSSTPHGATVTCTVTRPAVAAGDVLAQAGLGAPRTIGGDTIPARQATLLDIEQQSGTPPVGYEQVAFELLDDPASTEGQFESHGVFGRVLDDLLTVEGDYTFHCRATYGHDHPGAREHVWTLHVDAGIDAARTGIDVARGAAQPGGDTRVRITLTPRDRYGHLLGPGRAEAISVAGTPGTTVIGLPADNGDGTYTVDGAWDPGSGLEPGVAVQQPDRPGAVLGGGEGGGAAGLRRCWWWALAALVLAVIVVVLLVILLAT